MIECEVLLDSISPFNIRLTSWILQFPRWILCELLTHRVFSRNSSSSRAIPVSKMVGEIRNNPAIPIHWGKAQKGMQAETELDVDERRICQDAWIEARNECLFQADCMRSVGLHKQVANRILEPWAHMAVILTGTEFENFFALRADEMAQPEFRELAEKMLTAYNASIPRFLNYGEWHIPFGDKYCEGLSLEQKLKVSVARAARVSYKTFEGIIDYQKDYELHDRLIADGHWSSTEHAAFPIPTYDFCGNLRGWKQYRKTFPNEVRSDPRVIRYRVNERCEVVRQ